MGVFTLGQGRLVEKDGWTWDRTDFFLSLLIFIIGGWELEVAAASCVWRSRWNPSVTWARWVGKPQGERWDWEEIQEGPLAITLSAPVSSFWGKTGPERRYNPADFLTFNKWGKLEPFPFFFSSFFFKYLKSSHLALISNHWQPRGSAFSKILVTFLAFGPCCLMHPVGESLG